VAALPGLVAHGGVGGAIIELLLVLTIAAVFFAVWLRERRSSPDEDRSDEDQSRPQ
jgi:hypothetical protein